MVKVIGISGSPIPNSGTDRAVKKILEESGLEYEFIKLSDLNVRPCKACKACVKDNICKVKDDFPALAEKIKACQAMVIGAYTPYCLIDGYTKAFLERLWSMRHNNALNEGKYVISVVSSMMDPLADAVHQAIARENQMEDMINLGALTVKGNAPCLTCGCGHECKKSAAREAFMNAGHSNGKEMIVPFEAQDAIVEKATELGKLLKSKLG